jgi:hypothetical protein
MAVITADSPLLNSALFGLTDPPLTGDEEVNSVCLIGSFEQEIIIIMLKNRTIFFIFLILNI